MKPERAVNVLRLIDKEIDVYGSTVMFDRTLNKQNIFSVFDMHNSDWSVENGWLTGKNPSETAGMAIIKQEFTGNILLEFECRTVLPSTRDINFMWNTEWSQMINSCGNGYVGSICGWWTKRAGIEKSPDFKLRATSSNFTFKAGKTYKVCAGNIDGNCFIFIDDRLLIELYDPDPIDTTKYNKVAFSAYSSWVQFKNIIIRQITYNPLRINYKPEF